jgi:8-oxo-dGTP diphosphatase
MSAAQESPQPVRAAGGLLWRPDPAAGRLVCLVHRPRYDDWTLPKGKLLPGEHPLMAAVREVGEETGYWGVPQLPLAPSRYRVADAPKHVDFWAMVAADRPSSVAIDRSEVDQVGWLPVPTALARLTHPRDAAKLRHWASLPPVTGVVLLVRHADAGTRLDDPAVDAARPLSANGVCDAASLCRVLALFAPGRLISAAPARCVQTLAPLAGTGTGSPPIEVDDTFAERAGDPQAATARLRQLAATGVTTVICSQGAVVPPVLAGLAGPAAVADGEADRSAGWATAKGDGWLLPFSGPLLLAAARLRP